MQFKCPVCECSAYQRVIVLKERGALYETEFFHCLGCSLMFLEPDLFTASSAFREEQRATVKLEAGPNSGAPNQALGAQSMRSRFWYARARRLRGGWEPTSDEVARLRDRYRQ